MSSAAPKNNQDNKPSHSEKRIAGELQYHKTIAANEATNLSPCPDWKLDDYRNASRYRQDPYHQVLQIIHSKKPASILEIGSGSGVMMTRLAKLGHSVTGVELSPDLVELAKARIALENVSSRARVIECDACDYQNDEKFDIVLAPLVLHHLDFPTAISSIKRMLKPGGMLVAMEPVAFSRPLQILRDILPVKKIITPEERQLNQDDLDLVKKEFKTLQINYFYCFGRLRRFIPKNRFRMPLIHKLQNFDAAILELFPFTRNFAGTVVFVAVMD